MIFARLGTESNNPDAHSCATFATILFNEHSRGVSPGGQPNTSPCEMLNSNVAIVEAVPPMSDFYCLKAASKITESKDLDVILSANEVPWPIWVGARDGSGIPSILWKQKNKQDNRTGKSI